MKVFILGCMLLASVSSFSAENGNLGEIEKEKASTEHVESATSEIDFSNLESAEEDFECSITSSGTVETANGSFTATLTVTGPCDASLAGDMRAAIKALRDSFN
uniref:hypothetical protein n=1 Tax=uncultured Christiangramia sp. TaxID=503836 RepID=UPI0026194E1F|nr:hypothetical protein [uncultured Christiangramia sp.]